MNPFQQRKDFLLRLKTLKPSNIIIDVKSPPENLFVKCPSCSMAITQQSLSRNKRVCPSCEHHFPVSAHYRMRMILDEGKYVEINADHSSGNPLDFPGYTEKLKSLRKITGLNESVITALGEIGGINAVVCVMDSRFMMGSMGTACGEKITRAIEYATENKLALIIFSASGGARMQEGILSLFQMAKTSAAIERHSKERLLYISILTHPTTGGVTASFASLGDIILAEPKALIGFAGPRVIEQTIGQKLPSGFQRAEYLMEHGFIDSIIPRNEMKKTLSLLLQMHDWRR